MDGLNEKTELLHKYQRCEMDTKLYRKLNKLDSSQHKAVHEALKNRVALIQGPPVPGKHTLGCFWHN